MRRNPLIHSLSTTTALIASLSLAFPAPVFAQTDLPNCTDGTAAPCLPGLEPLGDNGKPMPGTKMTRKEIAARKAAEAGAAEPAQDENPESINDAAPAEGEAATADEMQPETAPADEGTAADVSVKKGKKVGGKGKKNKAALDDTSGDQPAADESTAPATEETTAPVTEKTAAPAAEEATVPAAEETTAPVAQEETAPAGQPETGTAAEATGEAAAPATEATTDATTGEQTKRKKKRNAKADAASTAPENSEATAPVPATETVAPATEAPVADATVPVLPVQPDAATGEAPVAAAAAAAPEAAGTAADAPPPAGATVVEETVTEDSVRSSSEDFATTVNQTLTPEQKAAADTSPAAKTAAKKKKDKGLTDFEKALLVGVGAVAVGAILSNNRRVAANSGDRVVVEQQDGSYAVIKDDDALLRQPGSTVRTERFADGSTRATVTRADGSRIVTIRDAEYRVLRRVHIAPDGRQTLLIDDTTRYAPVVVSTLPPPRRPREVELDDETALRLALAGEARDTGRAYSLAQIRDIDRVRELAPAIDLRAITFDTGSAAISPDQARGLSTLGGVIEDFIAENPREVFLVEGHTDAVGNAAYNLALSDRRAETVALALTEYFDIPPENLVVQGYGEEFLKVDTQGAERANRRATVRRITDLLQQASN